MASGRNGYWRVHGRLLLELNSMRLVFVEDKREEVETSAIADPMGERNKL